MAKYSSDSDSDQSSSRYSRRKQSSRRSSSLDSNDSSSSYQRRQKYSRTKRRHRSRTRSRDRSNRNSKYSSKGSSRDQRRYRKSRSLSSDRNREKKRSASVEKSKSKSSTSSQSNAKSTSNSDKFNIATAKDNFLMSNMKIKASVLSDINSDEFIPKEFVSSAKNKESKIKNIMIDVYADKICAPQITNASSGSNNIFHTSVMADKDSKFDKWVKKLHLLRQKTVHELNNS